MGRQIRAQRRGKGTQTYRAKSFRGLGAVSLPHISKEISSAEVIDILHDLGRSSPVARIRYPDGHEHLVLAPQGVKVGDRLECGISAPIQAGNTLTLAEIPEGTSIHSIEGRFVRASGTHATLVAHDVGQALVELPSGEIRGFNPRALATIGVVAGGGRIEKPFVKAGKKHRIMLAKGKPYPRVRGVAMNVVDHPFGGGRGKHAGRPKTTRRGAPPGQKVGLIAAKRTGKR